MIKLTREGNTRVSYHIRYQRGTNEESASMVRQKGIISEWYDQKGYGFISPIDGQKKIFTHISSMTKMPRRPRINDKVIFTLGIDNQNRPCTKQVKLTRAHHPPFNVLFSVGFMVAASIAIFLMNREPLVISVYLILSLITYSTYYFDKKAAQQGKWRISESTLHLLSLCGGWPGALCAQHYLNHKSKKQPFKRILWLIIVVNITLFVLTLIPSGISLVALVQTLDFTINQQ